MRSTFPRICLLLAALGPVTSSLAGCHIVVEAARRDAETMVQLPKALADAAHRDLKIYERVH
jgi:hypothetical protein